jgi:threonine dehydratase
MIPIDDIRRAAARIGPHVHRTPLFSSRSLGEAAGASVYLKCESFQKTGSFKPRGALNKVLSLPEEDRGRGLVTVSAGNHAQAVAWAASRSGVPCTVVMPAKAPSPKVAAVEGYGARIVFHDDNATLFDRLRAVEKETCYVFSSSTILSVAGRARPVSKSSRTFERPVYRPGRGQTHGGVASVVKAPRGPRRPVELAEGPGLAPMAAGRPIPVSRPANAADGLVLPRRRAALEIARETPDTVVTVTEEEIADASPAADARELLSKAEAPRRRPRSSREKCRSGRATASRSSCPGATSIRRDSRFRPLPADRPPRRGYLPENFGVRFSTLAASPSLASFDLKRSDCSSRSRARADSIGISEPV